MTMGNLFLMTVTVMIAMLITTDACSQEKLQSWQPMGFSERFRHYGIMALIQGRVTRMYPGIHISQFGGVVFTAEVELECIYRGGSALRQSSSINITGFGETNDCVNTLVDVGGRYLIFVEAFAYNQYIQYAVHEFNTQRGVVEATNSKIATVASVYECRGVSNTTTTLAPWKSLTPIKEVPWLIPPKGASRETVRTENGGNATTTPCFIAIVILAVVNLLRNLY